MSVGRVIDLALRSTQLETFNNALRSMPNSTMAMLATINLGFAEIRIALHVTRHNQ